MHISPRIKSIGFFGVVLVAVAMAVAYESAARQTVGKAACTYRHESRASVFSASFSPFKTFLQDAPSPHLSLWRSGITKPGPITKPISDSRVSFSLTNQHGDTVTQKDFGGRHLLPKVFFGFTNCHGICPTHMSNLTRVMAELDDTGHSRGVTPVFISVDPERVGASTFPHSSGRKSPRTSSALIIVSWG